MTKIFLKTFAALFLLFASPAGAQEVTLDDFTWLAGQWVEERDDGTTIEINWAPPIGQVMVGTWQLLQGDTLVEYKNMRIFKTGRNFYYRFEYYQKNNLEIPDITQLNLVSVEEGKAVFEGQYNDEGPEFILTSEINQDGKLFGWAVQKNDPFQIKTVGFRATRVGE